MLTAPLSHQVFCYFRKYLKMEQKNIDKKDSHVSYEYLMTNSAQLNTERVYTPKRSYLYTQPSMKQRRREATVTYLWITIRFFSLAISCLH